MQIGFSGLLFIVFLVLKLTGVIAWSWLWVTAPLWIGFVLTVIVLVIAVGVAAGTANTAAKTFGNNRRSTR